MESRQEFSSSNKANLTERVAYLLACILSTIWLALILNLGELLNGRVSFDSPRLNALTELCTWFIPWAVISAGLFFRPWWIKAISIILISAYAYISLLSVFQILNACETVIHNNDSRFELMESKPIDTRTTWYLYRVKPGALSSYRRLICTKTTISPGILWVHTLEYGRYYEKSSSPHPAQVVDGINFAPYMAQVQQHIKEHWHPSSFNKSKHTVVQFKIHRNGSISQLRISSSSGIPEMDQAALNAINQAAPFPPLPAGAPSDVDIEFTFDYNVFHK